MVCAQMDVAVAADRFSFLEGRSASKRLGEIERTSCKLSANLLSTCLKMSATDISSAAVSCMSSDGVSTRVSVTGPPGVSPSGTMLTDAVRT